LKIVLEDSTERMTLQLIWDNWLPDYWKPSMMTLRRWLEVAVAQKKVERFGKGRCRSPFRYALPGRKFGGFADLPPMPDINEMDRERYG
jgi:hypothetical protein